MFALNRSLLNEKYTLINVLMVLASIIPISDLHIILLSRITPRYLHDSRKGCSIRSKLDDDVTSLPTWHEPRQLNLHSGRLLAGLPRQGQETLVSTVSRLRLGPTQPHTSIQWSLGVNRPECEAHRSPPSSAEVKKTSSYISTPTRLHGMVLN
jgi:hypothetical protein